MANWIHERSFIYLLSVVLIPLVGLLFVCWGLWGKRRYRWLRIVPGVALVLLWACLPMEDWFGDIDTWSLEDDIYLFGLAAGLLIGPVLVCWGAWGDRSNGRARCPKCWHDMRGTLPQLTCPMCTHDARQTRRLYKSRYRWRLIALGVVLALLSAYHETSHWFHTTGVYMLGVALIPGVGLLLVCWGVWGDRSRGRVRCPKCWYDMRGTVPRLECPECGHDAQQERQLYRTRRGRRRIILGIGLVLLSTYPLTIIGGWWREQAAIRTYEIRSPDQKSIGPAWLVERLPDELARFFDRCDGLNVDESAQLPALQRLRHLRWLAVRAEDATDADLVHLMNLSKLEDLGLDYRQVTAVGLARLKDLSNLTALGLANTRLTDAGLVHLKGLSNLTALRLANTRLTDAGLVHLKGLSNLAELGLANTQLTDAGLVHLKDLSKLEHLDLRGTQVTDVGLVHLKGLSKLKLLVLTNTQITGVGLVHLKGLSDLQWLALSDTQLTGIGLEHLRGLSNLDSLRLMNTPLTDAGLENLKGLSQLLMLSLANTQVTDAGLVHLAGLSKLKYLGLSGTQVTDAGLVHLIGLSKLDSLDLIGTQVTDVGAAKLKQALPNLTVSRP